ncbi:hypothetical protein KR222_007450 [Zaprionus bogoriensis]|nr:hypothetical protein KR222_007450 [Zaprionus bogoriensis]
MPICKSSPAAATSKKTATDISADHVTEAAQVKRTREQAYFNSYDFDAIEVLPYDEGDDEESRDNNIETASTVAAGITKFAYLQRLGSFFGHKDGAADGATASASVEAVAEGVEPEAAATIPAGQSNRDNFLLPRAMLKYQYQRLVPGVESRVVQMATPMPLTECQTGSSLAIKPVAATAATAAAATRNKKRSTASNASSTHTTDSGLGTTTAVIAATATATPGGAAVGATGATVGARRAGSGSHYSTDKSGSSGYYSSHVCSTYSLDEHIYCEPVIDTRAHGQHLEMRDVPTAAAAATATAASAASDSQPQQLQLQQLPLQQQQQHQQKQLKLLPHYSEKLRVLETSIENLDRHLKSFPHLVSSHPQLPTIVEGFDKQQQQQQQQLDDSLLDIDLDAFLLQPSQKHQQHQQQLLAGIDNPSFLSDEQLAENNYKCAKYINSCPEDAYRLDNESSSAYTKRYEDQLHFQSTRELLEDVRDKIRLLAPTPTTDIPHELEGMIETLKNELESYLQRMNQHSELELRQLCSGLGRQQHVVRLQNALERRRSYAGVCDGVLIAASSSEQLLTIRCASDPNFKMKRKSITEVFPIAECYVENSVTPPLTTTPTPTPTPTPTTMMVTQLQRNLNFHKPILAVESSGSASASSSAGGTGSASISASTSGPADKLDSVAEWHRKKPSIWEMYYGTNRLHQSLLGKQRHSSGQLVISSAHPTLSYPSSRPESDFTLDLPRAEQLRLKMEKEKKFRQRCRFITTFLSLVFFLLTVMVVSLVLTRGKRMFGSMI